MILITGGAGFIGTNFIYTWFKHYTEEIINLDCLSYAANINNIDNLLPCQKQKYIFIQLDISETQKVINILHTYKPRAIIHFAAQTHVDRSITDPQDFIINNILGTFNLLQACKIHYDSLNIEQQQKFKFIHISTDEVYGSLEINEPAFTEKNSYAPNSPYSASKASSDHIVRSYFHTYNLPCIITHCSNNYGYYQFPEKLIPLIIKNALQNKDLPIYGNGLNIRDWLYVTDHCNAIIKILNQGTNGEVYNIASGIEKTNLDIVNSICTILDELYPKKNGLSYKTQIKFIKDRAGHDKRYAVDTTKITTQLNWKPLYSFEQGIYKTIQWYLDKLIDTK